MTSDPPEKTDKVAQIEYPTRLISSADYALNICSSAYLAHARMHYSIYNQMEQFDGLLPYSPEELREANMSWISNVPYRAGWVMIENASTARLNMLKSAIYFSQPCFRPFEDGDEKKPEYFFLTDPVLARNYAARLGKIFIDTLERDQTFIREFLLKLAYNQVAWGYAVSMCEDYCVLPYIPEILNVYFERADRLENIKFFILVFYMRAQDLYALHQREEKRGWENSFYEKEGLEEALVWAINRLETRSYNSWAEVTRTYDPGDLWGIYGNFTDTMSWAWIWNEEIEGGVTKTLWLWNRGQINNAGVPNIFYNAQSTMPNGTHLSYQRHYPDKKLEDIWRLYPNTGMTNTNIAQDLKGLAPFAYEYDIQNNIKRNAINDAVTTQLPMKLQPGYGRQTNATSDLNITGGLMVLPPDLSPVREDGSGRNIEWAIASLNLDREQYDRNTSQFNPQVSGRLKDRATDDQVAAITSEVNRERSDFATVPMKALSGVLLDILHRTAEGYEKDDPGYDTANYLQRRIENELYSLTGQAEAEEPQFTAKEFIRALVQAVDYISLDYATNDVLSLQRLVEMAPTPEGKAYYMRKLAMANGATWEELNTIWPLSDSPDLNINNSSLAFVENYMFWDTGEVAYNALQNPVAHLEAHLTKGIDILRGAQGGDLVQMFKWFSNMLPHAAMHLQQLATNPFEQENFERFSQTYKELVKVADEVGRGAQEQARQIAEGMSQQEAQQQPQISPETMAKIQQLEIDKEAKRKRADELYRQRTEQSQARFDQQMRQSEERHRQQMEAQAQTAALQQIQMENR